MFTEKIEAVSATTGIGPEVVRTILEAAHPEVTSLTQLENLPVETTVQTSDISDTVVTRTRTGFMNSSGYEVPADTLWRFGAKPFRILFQPSA